MNARDAVSDGGMTAPERGPVRLVVVAGDRGAARQVAADAERADGDLSASAAGSAAAVLDRVDGENVDCVVSSYRLPETDGVALLESVREAAPELPFVLCAAEGSEAVASRATEAGVSVYLPRAPGDGQADTLAAHCRRLAEQYRVRRALAESHRRFRSLVDNLPGMAYRCRNEPGWPMEYVSEGCRDLTGYDPEQLVAGEVSYGEDVIHPDDREAVWEAVQAALERGETYRTDYRITTAEGEQRWVWEQGSGVVDDGEVVALEGFVTDVTDRRRTREELAERNQRLDAFASIVSHDLRNPLNVASGHLELARADCESPHLAEVASALDRMEALIDDLLTLSREGQTVGDVRPVELADVARQCWSNVETPGAELRIRTDATLLADEQRVDQLLENLFRNSVEHSSTGSRTESDDSRTQSGDSRNAERSGGNTDPAVTVTVGELDDGDGFYVEDDGPGIPPEERDRVFETGYTTAPDGTGIGLGIVSNIVAEHGWEIAVTEGSAGGARFEITGIEIS